MFLEQGARAASTFDSGLLVIALIVLGLAALAVELFVIPGFGLAGVAGILMLIGGVVSAWLMFGPLYGGITILVTLGLTVVLGVVV